MRLSGLLCHLTVLISLLPTLVFADDLNIPPLKKNGIVNIAYHMDSGIGNRIKKTISYLRYYHPRHMNIYWPIQGWVTSSFYDLFTPNWETQITEYNQLKLWQSFNYRQELFPYIDEYALLITAEDFTPNQPFLIDQKYSIIPEHIKEIYLPYFSNLHPSAKVQKRIDEVKLPKDYVSVQVRNAPDWEAYFHGNAPLENFYEVMDNFPQDTIFYLSTMSAEVAAPFYTRYPNRIVELPNKDYHSMIDATADMFLLGRAQRNIFATRSSFSEVAWWLGGAKGKVTLITSLKQRQDQSKNMELPILPYIPR